MSKPSSKSERKPENQLTEAVHKLQSVHRLSGLLDWPYNELLYQVISVVAELEQHSRGGFFAKDYLEEKLGSMHVVIEMIFCARCSIRLADNDIGLYKYCPKCLKENGTLIPDEIKVK